MVGIHQIEQFAPHGFRILRDGHVESRRVARNARPMPLEGEQYALGDLDGGEDTPASEQAGLSGRKRRVGGQPEDIVVENVTVEHPAILTRGARFRSVGLPRRPHADPPVALRRLPRRPHADPPACRGFRPAGVPSTGLPPARSPAAPGSTRERAATLFVAVGRQLGAPGGLPGAARVLKSPSLSEVTVNVDEQVGGVAHEDADRPAGSGGNDRRVGGNLPVLRIQR